MRTPITYPFLILATNSHEAIWLKVEGENKFEEIAGAVDPKAQFSDNELRVSPAGHDGHEWEEETKQHLKRCGEKTKELWETKVYTRLVVAAPEELKNQVHDILHHAHAQLEYTYLPIHTRLLLLFTRRTTLQSRGLPPAAPHLASPPRLT
jgi:hypothetical protein